MVMPRIIGRDFDRESVFPRDDQRIIADGLLTVERYTRELSFHVPIAPSLRRFTDALVVEKYPGEERVPAVIKGCPLTNAGHHLEVRVEGVTWVVHGTGAQDKLIAFWGSAIHVGRKKPHRHQGDPMPVEGLFDPQRLGEGCTLWTLQRSRASPRSAEPLTWREAFEILQGRLGCTAVAVSTSGKYRIFRISEKGATPAREYEHLVEMTASYIVLTVESARDSNGWRPVDPFHRVVRIGFPLRGDEDGQAPLYLSNGNLQLVSSSGAQLTVYPPGSNAFA